MKYSNNMYILDKQVNLDELDKYTCKGSNLDWAYMAPKAQ